MTEQTIPSERVRDLASAPRRLPIEIEGSVTCEIVLTVWSIFNPKESNSVFDLGPEWRDEMASLIPEHLAEEIEVLGGPHAYAWLGISCLLLAAPHPHDPDRAFEWLATVGEKRLRRWLLGYSSQEEDQALIEQAAEGDVDAALQLVGEWAEKKPGLTDFLEMLVTTEGLPSRYATALMRFRSEAFAGSEEDHAAAISRAAAARRATPVRGDAKEIVEEVTSGIDFEIPLGITRVVLVPSVVIRPLSMIDGHRGTLVVYYGIADEFINSDPEAPPSWLVRTYKALSDDKRLRILRRVSEGGATLDELTEMLGIAKSTVHHHVSLLRGAGLLRVHLPDDESKGKQRRYTLREASLGDAAGFLDSYLRHEVEEQAHA